MPLERIRELVEPIPVRVTEGRIRGSRQSPIADYVPKPVKPEDEEIIEDAGDASAAEAPAG